MKRLILSVLAVFAIAAIVVGCGSSNTELQGTWRTTLDDANIGSLSITYTFSGNNWECTWASTTFNAEMSGTFTFDSTANPKTLDLLFTYADEMFGFTIEGGTLYGIYQLSGTNLTLTFGGDPGTARPTSFTDSFVLVLSKQ